MQFTKTNSRKQKQTTVLQKQTTKTLVQATFANLTLSMRKMNTFVFQKSKNYNQIILQLLSIIVMQLIHFIPICLQFILTLLRQHFANQKVMYIIYNIYPFQAA